MKGLNTILVTEDDPNDVYLVKRAFDELGYSGQFHFFWNARTAINYLTEARAGGSPERSPQLITTDIKMPGGCGFELLQWLKENPAPRTIPVVVLTSSGLDDRAYGLGAYGYFVKPASLHNLAESLRQIIGYWSSAEVPKDVH